MSARLIVTLTLAVLLGLALAWCVLGPDAALSSEALPSASPLPSESPSATPTPGAAADASSTPTGTLYVDGVADAATVTVTNITTGVYTAAVTLPTLTAGQVVALRIAATVGGVAGEGIVWQEVADTARASDVLSAAFDPDTDTVARVTLVDTTTDLTNSPSLDLSEVLEAIAALPDDTDVAALDALLDAVKLKTDQIGAVSVTVSSPVAETGTVTIYQSADYDADDSRSIQLTYTDVPDLTGATVELRCSQATWTAKDVAETDDGFTVTFELTSTETAALTVVRQSYQVWATLASGHLIPLSGGTLVVVRAIAAS